MQRKKKVILDILKNHGPELYGLEIMKMGDGKLKSGTLYITLSRMEDKGLIESKREGMETIYKILPEGLNFKRITKKESNNDNDME